MSKVKCACLYLIILCSFCSLSLFGLKLLCRVDEDTEREGEEEGYPKRVGVKSLIALISVLAAHPFSFSFFFYKTL